jgi:methane/ammonia monooxygenase subunit B
LCFWLEVPKFTEPASFATATATGSTFDPATDTLTVKVNVTNNSNQPATITSFNTNNLTFQTDKAAITNLTYGVGQLTAEPATIAAGATQEVTLTMTDEIWSRQRLIPVGESRLQVTGVLFLNAGGERNWVTIASPVIPTTYLSSN